MSGFRKLMEGAGLVQSSDDDQTSHETVAPAPLPSSSSAPQAPSPHMVTVAGAKQADPEKVELLWKRIASGTHIPLLSSFHEALDRGRLAAPNNEVEAVRLALIFSSIDKQSLLREIEKPVAASLDQEEQQVNQGIATRRTQALTELDDKERKLRSESDSCQTQIATLQKRAGELETELGQVVSEKASKEAEFAEITQTGEAILLAVRSRIDMLKQLISTAS